MAARENLGSGQRAAGLAGKLDAAAVQDGRERKEVKAYGTLPQAVIVRPVGAGTSLTSHTRSGQALPLERYRTKVR